MAYAGIRVERNAGEALTAFRCVRLYNAKIYHADAAADSHAAQLIGVVQEAAAFNAPADVRTYGVIRNDAWAWTVGLPIYCGEDGVLTQTQPDGWVRQVAIAETATKIFVDLRFNQASEENPTDTTLILPFAYGDATPALIGNAPAGKLISSVQLFIETAFDGAGPTLKVGKSGALDALLRTDQNDPATVGTYEAHPNLSYDADTALLLSISPGTSPTVGAGLLVVTYQP